MVCLVEVCGNGSCGVGTVVGDEAGSGSDLLPEYVGQLCEVIFLDERFV